MVMSVPPSVPPTTAPVPPPAAAPGTSAVRLYRAIEEAASPVSCKTRWKSAIKWCGGGSHAGHVRQDTMPQSGANRRNGECPDEGGARDGRQHIGSSVPGAHAVGR